MKTIFGTAIVLLLHVILAQAADDGVHVQSVSEAFAKCQELEGQGQQTKCVAFDPKGEWHVVYGRNGYWTSNTNSGVGRHLRDVNAKNEIIRWIAISPTGGHVVLFGENGWIANGVPPELAAALQRLNSMRVEIQCVSFQKNGGWLILCSGGDFIGVGIPPKALAELRELKRQRVRFENAAFIGDEGYVIVFDQFGYRAKGVEQWYLDALRDYNAQKRPLLCIASTLSGTGIVVEQNPLLPDVRYKTAKASASTRPPGNGWPFRDANGLLRIPTADEFLAGPRLSTSSFDQDSPIEQLRRQMAESDRELRHHIESMPPERRAEFLQRHYESFREQWRSLDDLARPAR